MDGESASVIPELIRDNLLIVLLLGVGLVLLSFGLFQILLPKEQSVVIEKSSGSAQSKAASGQISPGVLKEIVIDVEGAVLKPGIYSIPVESREEDAIKAAGGLSSHADRGVIARSMNMAAKVSDGMKLYLPFVGEQPVASVGDQSVQGTSVSAISINSASESQLDSLPGIGPVTAGKIITNRPYSSVGELLSKKSVTSSVYDKIKDLVTL